MTDTFAYDLVKFLRVIYLNRWFIFKGAAITGVLAMIVSLIWPQTWRANAGVFVSAPSYKKTLQLMDKQGFDVLWYESIMSSDSLYFEIIDTFKWMHVSTHHLLDTNAIDRLKQNLNEKAETLTKYQLIENTNLTVLAELLVPQGEKENIVLKTRISILGHLSNEGIEEIYSTDLEEYENLTVHDLRKNLHTSVAVLVDTNLEKIYSKRINVSAEAGTAAGSKILANIWLDLFQARAEKTVQIIINKQVKLTKQSAVQSEKNLVSAENLLKEFDKSNTLNTTRAEIASKQVRLTGMTEQRRISNHTDESFNLDPEVEWFMKEKRSQSDDASLLKQLPSPPL